MIRTCHPTRNPLLEESLVRPPLHSSSFVFLQVRPGSRGPSNLLCPLGVKFSTPNLRERDSPHSKRTFSAEVVVTSFYPWRLSERMMDDETETMALMKAIGASKNSPAKNIRCIFFVVDILLLLICMLE